VIAAVTVLIAGRSFFFYVGNLAVRGHFAIVAGDAAAGERRESEETD
jgi:hypothetical protein